MLDQKWQAKQRDRSKIHVSDYRRNKKVNEGEFGNVYQIQNIHTSQNLK